MSRNTHLNPKILRKIKENSSDPSINQFIEKLLFMEAEKIGNWRWKQEYKTLLEAYSLEEKQGVESK